MEGKDAVVWLKVVKMAGGPPGKDMRAWLIRREDVTDRDVADSAEAKRFFMMCRVESELL